MLETSVIDEAWFYLEGRFYCSSKTNLPPADPGAAAGSPRPDFFHGSLQPVSDLWQPKSPKAPGGGLGEVGARMPASAEIGRLPGARGRDLDVRHSGFPWGVRFFSRIASYPSARMSALADIQESEVAIRCYMLRGAYWYGPGSVLICA